MEYRVAIGNLAVGTGDYPTAIGEYKRVLEKVPASSDVWMRLGETQRRSGDTASAAASYKKAQELSPNNVNAFVQLALLYDVEGRRMDARPYYEQALRVQPNNMVALNNLAYMMADAGADLDQALTMAQKAKQQQPNNNNITDTLSWIYIKKNLPDTAIGLLRDLVQKEPERATYRYHLAVALHQKGDKAQAKREAELALKSKPPKEEEAKIRDLLSKLG
jgi:Flp pilus assembly protein TadD